MDEYLTESEQWERVKAWLRQNLPWLIAGIAIAVVGLAAWRWNEARKERQYAAAATVYQQLVDAFTKSDVAGAVKITDQLQKEHPGTGYAEQAALATARIMVENKQHAQAIERLQHVVQTTRDPELALLARLRIARVQIDQNKPDEALATLAAATSGAFASRYAEVRGDALLLKGDRDGALKAYREAASTGGAADAELLQLKINDLTRS